MLAKPTIIEFLDSNGNHRKVKTGNTIEAMSKSFELDKQGYEQIANRAELGEKQYKYYGEGMENA